MEGLQPTNTPFLKPWPRDGQSLLLDNKRSPLSIEKVLLFFEIFAIKYDIFVLLMGPLLDVMYPILVFPVHFHCTQDKHSYQDGKLSHRFGPITDPSVDMLL